jgi:phosphomannomutase
VVDQLVALAKFDAPAEVSTIDGLRVDWPDGFGLIRASNTTPVLVLRFEGQTTEALHRIEADHAGAAEAGQARCRRRRQRALI